ncbi:MAG TPA: hypothetical protein VHC98_00160 [Candidatus Saccharimonadales bacterium]|nr:hypothetical protein [Candidatus Saccharimonadales bacterium]
MQHAESILVIIVSTTLALFLLIAIVVLILIAKLVASIRRLVEHAERIMETASDAAEMLRNASGPLAAFKVLRNIMRGFDRMHK